MPADKATLTRRFDNLKKLGLLDKLTLTEEAVLEDIETADEDEDAGVVGWRYLLVKRIDYQGQPDSHEVENYATLEEVENEIIDFLCSDEERSTVDYAYFVDVYDLNLGKQLDFDVEIRVKWGLREGGDR